MAVGSFSSGLSGLNANGAYLSVIGNNLANINTVGFKSSTVAFSDLVSQSVGGTSVNPMQVGLGVGTSSISPIFSQGAVEATRETTNVAIQGNGFFVVTAPAGGPAGSFYTRAGNFSLNAAGDLATPDGYRLQNTAGAVITIPAGTESIAISSAGVVTGTTGGVETTIGTVALASFNNNKGLAKLGANLYSATTASGAATTGAPKAGGRGALIGSALEQSNVDIAQEFTQMILAQRGYQANSKTITVADELLVETLALKR